MQTHRRTRPNRGTGGGLSASIVLTLIGLACAAPAGATCRAPDGARCWAPDAAPWWGVALHRAGRLTLQGAELLALQRAGTWRRGVPVEALSIDGGAGQSSARDGIIVGTVVNERLEPVARATVQAFSADSASVAAQQVLDTVPQLKAAAGSASTDNAGRFRISGLPRGEYLIAAAPMSLFPSGGPPPPQVYGATFYPSTIDHQQAVRVSASAYDAMTVQIELVPVRGVRVSGSVVSSSGQPAGGLSVRLFQRFGSFGHAREALPRLTSLLNDDRKSNFGSQVSVADAARAAIARLQ
jgi:hypothetical protein